MPLPICPDCDRELFSDKCPCGWAPKRVASPWLVRYCATTGCNVRIRELVGAPGASTCKWCQQGLKLATSWCRAEDKAA
jgi:hypothetical protein